MRFLTLFFTAFFAIQVQAAEPIKVGDIMSYSSIASVTEPYKEGWTLAVEEINADGGVLGRPLEVISLDAKGDPAEAIRLAQELIERDEVDVLYGTVFDHIKLAVSSVAKQYKIPFFCVSAGTDKLIKEQNHPYVVRTDVSSGFLNAVFAEEAAKLPAKRWATIAPSIEYGQVMVEDFKRELKKRRPDVEFVDEQWYAWDKLDAGAAVQALLKAKPDAIMSGVLGGDLPNFLRQGKQRELFEGRTVVAPYMGAPGFLAVTGDETPTGWITSGYPSYTMDDPKQKAFIERYTTRFDRSFRITALHGYITMKAVAQAIEEAGTTDPEAVAKEARQMVVDTLVGPMRYRESDGQSNLGLWLGKTGFVDGKPTIVDWRYVDETEFNPQKGS